MIINEVKKQRQLEGIHRWVKNKCHGILVWATGVGKTYGAVLAIEYIETKRTPTYLIALPSQPVLNQFKSMFESFFNEETMSRIIFKTIHELENEEVSYVVDVFIIDEIHEYTTDKKIKYINGERIEYKALLGLTASVTDYSFKRILQFVTIVDEITEKEAEEKNFIAKFHEFNVRLELTEAERERYDKVTESVNLHMPKFDNNLDIAQKCLNGGYFIKNGNKKYYTAIQWATTYATQKGWSENLNLAHESHRAIADLWSPPKIVGYARQLIKSIRDRKYLLEHSVAKFHTALAILNKFNQVKTIVFSENTVMVDSLYEELKHKDKVVKYHSNLETIVEPSRKTGKLIKKGIGKQKEEAIDDFKSSKARILLSTRAVDKGLNVPDIRLGLTISGSSKTTQYEQRGGRVKRTEEEDTSDTSLFGEAKALLINLYLKDTQDEIWLKNRQRFVEHFIYDVTSIDDISYTPPPNEEFIVDF
jgi:superfamily II DNA or RNA helicase